MLAVDKDLRHARAAAGAPDHLVAPPRFLHQVDLGELHPLAFEQRAGMRAIGAPHRAVHLDLGHRAGSPRLRLASIPKFAVSLFSSPRRKPGSTPAVDTGLRRYDETEGRQFDLRTSGLGH